MALSIKKRSSKAAKSVVGLDLDPAHVAAAEVDVNGVVAVKRGAVKPLAGGVLRDGEVTDAPALTAAIEELWAEHDLPKTVRLGIANQRIVVRTLDMPVLEDPKALDAAVRLEAPDHVPMPMDEAVLDFQPLGIVDTPAGPRQQVVVVAVRREMVARYMDAVRAAGLKIEGVDLSAFALVRSMYNKLQDEDASGVLWVNVAGLTNVAVTCGSHCLFTRAAAGGLDSMVQTLADRRGLTAEHSAAWLGHVGLETELDAVEGDPDIVAAARAVLEEGAHQLADTVRNSLNFYRMQQNAAAVERAVLTGPAVAIPAITRLLSEQLGIVVEGRTVAQHGEVPNATSLAVAAGLAVEAI